MNITTRLLSGAATAAMLLGATAASADDQYWANSLRVGAYGVFYHTSSTELVGPYAPDGLTFKAKDLSTLYFAYVRSIGPDFDIELAGGYPPLSKVEGRGPATVGSVPYNGQVISSARWISPTLFLEYKFLPATSPVRPFIGVGVNYTTFYDRDSNAQGDAASGGPTKISLTSSVGPAATAGLAWNVSGHWHAYASYSFARVDSNITTDTDGVERTARIKFGPQTLVVSGGYSF